MTPGSVFVLLLVAVACAFAIRSEIRSHKQGGSCAGCAGCGTGTCSKLDVEGIERALDERERRKGCNCGSKRHG